MILLRSNQRRVFCTYKVTKHLFTKLERLSALKLHPEQDLEKLEEDIKLAQKIFDVNTSNVRPLYNVSEDYITCPMRDDDTVEVTTKEEAFMNSKNEFEGFFIAPSVVGIQRNNKLEQDKTNDNF